MGLLMAYGQTANLIYFIRIAPLYLEPLRGLPSFVMRLHGDFLSGGVNEV
jgi:hypothetical protein